MNSVAALIAPVLEKEGFLRNAEGFFRVRPQFADYISIQIKSDSSAVALNAGVQPLFLLSPEKQVFDALREASEVDCYVRTRLAPEGQVDYWLSLALNSSKLVAEAEVMFIERGRPFFELFKSVLNLCNALTIEGIQSNKVPKFFSMVTKSRLALLGAKANLVQGNPTLATEFAEYGLTVSGMAVNLKREFKCIITGT